MADKKKLTKKELAARAKAVEQAKLAEAEADLVNKYGEKVVIGSIKRARKGSLHEGRLTVEVRTKGIDGEYDGNTRRVATSDVFQVNHTKEVAEQLDRQRRNERARARRAERRAAAAAEAESAA